MDPFQERISKIDERRSEMQDQFNKRMHDAGETAERVRIIARHPMQNAEKALAHQRPDGVIGEWKNVNPEDQNFFQRIADRTHGFLTPGNLVTIAGAGVTGVGLYHYAHDEYVKGTLYCFLGRFGGDLGDGAAAAVTETRGAPGALLDASVDKLLAVAYVAIAVNKGHMSPAEAITHGLQQARIARESVRLKLAGGEPNPSRFGKYGQAALWLRGGGDMCECGALEMNLPKTARFIRAGTEIAKHAAIILNERAADAYERDRVNHNYQQPGIQA